MIKVGVTGSTGFVGKHISNALKSFSGEFQLIDFDHNYFENKEKLISFVKDCDVIIHLAALNRHPDPQFLRDTNIILVKKLVDACIEADVIPKIIFSSSIQEDQNNPYGISKKIGKAILEQWSTDTGAPVTVLTIPNVFGPLGRPHYNSVVSTFCYQLINGETPQILIDGSLKLIYVKDLVAIILDEVRNKETGSSLQIAHKAESKVSEILEKLEYYKLTYFMNGEMPLIETPFQRDLFETFQSYIN